MSGDFYFVYGENGKATAAFRKSEVQTVVYGMNNPIMQGASNNMRGWGCYVNNAVFLPNIDIETFFREIMEKGQTQ